MKKYPKAPLALAVTALMVAPYAMAQESPDHTSTSSVTSNFLNNIAVGITHNANSSRTITVTGNADFDHENYGGALVDSKQFTESNDVVNYGNDNDASIGDEAMAGAGTAVGEGASGNIGVNVAAGDANSQANDAALATSDAASVFGQAAAYSAQTASNNSVINAASTNSATVGEGALAGATGNIAVNVAAGVGNAQQNSLAAATSTGAGSVEATAGGVQQTFNNSVENGAATAGEYEVELVVSIDASEFKMDQIGDVYLDMWGAEEQGGDLPEHHPAGPVMGHVDVDDEVQGAQDLNGDGGAFAFGAAGDTTLAGTVSGSIPLATVEAAQHSNVASLGSGALAGASGNIGVNIASGSNNLQRNSLSIASVTGAAPSNGGGGEGGPL